MQGKHDELDKKKIGLLGGTFNPIHIGHLIIAELACEQYGLDKVFFIPANKPPHKLDDEIASDEDRVAMVELAVQGNPHFEVSLVEMQRGDISYTVDTLRQLTKAHSDVEFYFIIGGDSVANIETWREPATIMKLAHILACVRDEVDDETLASQIRHLEKAYQAKIGKINIPMIDISSTLIRDRVRNHQSIRYLVPDQVNAYIKDANIYTEG